MKLIEKRGIYQCQLCEGWVERSMRGPHLVAAHNARITYNCILDSFILFDVALAKGKGRRKR